MRMEVYAAMIDRVDQNVGRLVAKLKETGKLDNTLILFLGDNGASPEKPTAKNVDADATMGSVGTFESIGRAWATACNTPLRKWKTASHEGGACTPMIAHWPAVIKDGGKFYREAAHLIDIMPTVTEITYASYPGESKEAKIPPMDGVSLAEAFGGGKHRREKPLFWQFGAGSAIRKGKWKLVRSGSEWELYDMSKDRTETTDLVSKYSEKAAAMGTEWEAWYQECTGTTYVPRKKKAKSKGASL